MIAEVAAKMTQLKVFTHVSTAYVNSFKEQYSHIEEKIYPLPLRNGKLLDHVQVATELYSVDPAEADRRVRFPLSCPLDCALQRMTTHCLPLFWCCAEKGMF
jgi:hypothetical protein